MSENTLLGTDWHEKIFTGTWTAGAGESYDVIEPATGESLGRLGAASADDVNAAATRAAAAQKEWARTTPAERAAVLHELGCVDFVTAFDEDSPVSLIERLRPEIYTKGGDYTAEMVPEADAVRRYGGEVRILDYLPHRSTTETMARIIAGRAPGGGATAT